jgi:AmpD protein
MGLATRRTARWPSPNCDARPARRPAELIVIHAISLPPGEFGGPGSIGCLPARLDPEAHPYYAEIRHLRVSAHFLIRRDGELLQFVLAAGAPGMPVPRRGAGGALQRFLDRHRARRLRQLAFEDAQYLALNRLLDELRRRYPIEALAGHSDIAPGRKTDPGPYFDWHRVGGEA